MSSDWKPTPPYVPYKPFTTSSGQNSSGWKFKKLPKDKLLDISEKNLELVDFLLQEITKLDKANKKADADKLVRVAREILDNNKKLQEVVGELTKRT